ncbi:MAG: YdjY domain-containing protein [Deltaproteobacteria bacterium]|nr:YdjY domain-containing protein [Deltaproteobacteria bacterium]
MKKKRFVLPLVMVVSFVLFTASLAFAAETALTPQNPISVDAKGKTVSILAQVNGKYFVETTRHAVVFNGGKFGDKAVLAGLVDPKTFHDALIKAGFKAGNNMTMDNKEKTFVEGDLLDVSVTWKGAKKAYTLNEIINDSNKKPIAIRFGGNLPLALEKNTGCLICLDSCPVGITSNAAYTYGAVEGRKEVGFTGNKDVLPVDKSLVTITFKAKK